jgi:hypothetical protein
MSHAYLLSGPWCRKSDRFCSETGRMSHVVAFTW